MAGSSQNAAKSTASPFAWAPALRASGRESAPLREKRQPALAVALCSSCLIGRDNRRAGPTSKSDMMAP